MKTLVAAAALLVSLGLAGAALAKAEVSTAYPYEQVWPAAVRFLRIDAGLTIVDKDSEAGYVVFELREDGKTFTGALELVRSRDGDAPRVKLLLRIDDRPQYMEAGLLHRLLDKLRTEYGPPEPVRPAAPPPPSPVRRPRTPPRSGN
jgi:hypothetical protein